MQFIGRPIHGIVDSVLQSELLRSPFERLVRMHEEPRGGLGWKPLAQERISHEMRANPGGSSGPARPGGKKSDAQETRYRAAKAALKSAEKKVEKKVERKVEQKLGAAMGNTMVGSGGRGGFAPLYSLASRREFIDPKTGDAIISGSDYLGPATITDPAAGGNNVVGGIITSFNLNPTQSVTLSLQQFAQLYQKFEFLEFYWEFKSAVSKFWGGTLNVLFDADPADIDGTGIALVRQAATTRSAHESSVLNSATWKWDAKREAGGEYYCAQDLATSSALRLTNQSHTLFHVVVPINVTTGAVTYPAVIGSVHVHYRVKFIHRQIIPPALSSDTAIGVATYIQDSKNNGNLWTGALVGNSAFFTLTGSSAGAPPVTTGGVAAGFANSIAITFPTAGNYFLAIGFNVTASLPGTSPDVICAWSTTPSGLLPAAYSFSSSTVAATVTSGATSGLGGCVAVAGIPAGGVITLTTTTPGTAWTSMYAGAVNPVLILVQRFSSLVGRPGLRAYEDFSVLRRAGDMAVVNVKNELSTVGMQSVAARGGMPMAAVAGAADGGVARVAAQDASLVEEMRRYAVSRPPRLSVAPESQYFR
jgi:hypothetical protein